MSLVDPHPINVSPILDFRDTFLKHVPGGHTFFKRGHYFAYNDHVLEIWSSNAHVYQYYVSVILEFIDIFPEHVDGINVFELRIENYELRIKIDTNPFLIPNS